MEEWYKQQTFFDEIKLEKIKKWTSEEVNDLLEYTRYSNRFSFAS